MVALSLRQLTLKHFDRGFVVFPQIFVHDASYPSDGTYLACLLDMLRKVSHHFLYVVDISQTEPRHFSGLVHSMCGS